MGFAASDQARVERDKCGVPAEGSWKRGRKQGAPQAVPAAGDAALAPLLTTVVVERGKASEGCSLLAADLAEFGHADQQRQRGALADPGNAEHQIKADSEIAVSA